MKRLVLAGLVAIPLAVAVIFPALIESLGDLLEATEDALSWEAS